ncbi:MAG: polyphosphate kinase 2 family protein [Anaerolineaceae bacterium]|jgi:PPK2 family polyphosphate:nucleotide phosphotransferase|nr:polyphosphate kinase 2 family protein [Anaerolineaceae bacterium]MDD4042750.1 polyphosphate kinase 2 family protein [Anaerolineaceae bacterium]MDD4577843.1 polyphosphate kinase 2 family protein [Anaerolineaceae bacterium]
MKTKKYMVKPGEKVKMKDFDPNDASEFDGKKKQGEKALLELNKEIEGLQELMYAEGKKRLLVILQAMDTAGKDGVIRKVFEGVNPQGVHVAPFKTPSLLELAHDYLWRIHAHTPKIGEIVIFNRSQYEDVLPVRVLNLMPEEVWSKRFHHINEFERMLVDEGTVILKFYLHIDLQEQAGRFLARIEEPDKTWKFNPGDLEDRKLWDDYMEAYEDILNKTSTEWAPWYVIPSNKKWYRNLLVATIVRDTLVNMNMQFPAPPPNLDAYRETVLSMVQAHKDK